MSTETSQNETQRAKENEEDMSIQELWDNFKRYNIHTIGIQEGEERESKREIFEVIMAKNILKLVTDTKLKIQKSRRIPVG